MRPAILTTYEGLLSAAKAVRKRQEAKGALFGDGVEEHAARAAMDCARVGHEAQINVMETTFVDYRIKPSVNDEALTRMMQTNEGRREVNRRKNFPISE